MLYIYVYTSTMQPLLLHFFIFINFLHTQMPVPGILLIGQDPSHLHQIAQALVGCPIPIPTPTPTTTTWAIDNRYYTANVAITICTFDQPPAPTSTIDHQAVVLCFDATALDSSVAAVQHLWSRVQDISSSSSNNTPIEDYEIKLAIAIRCTSTSDSSTTATTSDGEIVNGEKIETSVSSSSSFEQHKLEEEEAVQWIQDIDSWFASIFVELISVRSFTDRSQGINRVSDALQAHMWPGMERKTNSSTPAAARNGGDGDDPTDVTTSLENSLIQALGHDQRGEGDEEDLDSLFAQVVGTLLFLFFFFSDERCYKHIRHVQGSVRECKVQINPNEQKKLPELF